MTESEVVMGRLVRVDLVLTDWLKDGNSVYHDADLGITHGVFHAGTTFRGGIVVETADQEDDLRQALADGYEPVFAVKARE